MTMQHLQDLFHMSKLTYLAHGNRVSGPGSEDEA